MTKRKTFVKPKAAHPAPTDALQRKSVKPVVCYPTDTLPRPNISAYQALRGDLELIETVVIPPREARTWEVPAGHFCRMLCTEGPQVGDLNLFNLHDLSERFYSGKTRALNGTHVGVGDQLFSSFPYLRPIATITYDTLDWYGFDEFGGSVHDVIGTRCDPYTHNLLSHGGQYHHCCHSNLTRALAQKTGLTLPEAEPHVHDVLNVFMCTGFTRDTGQYFMKASPVRPGDYLEFFAEIDLLGCMSACPGGDCSSEHSSDTAACYPMIVEIYRPREAPAGWKSPAVNGYDRSHGA
ncbi:MULTISPECIES: DUF1989 domain-containing protein [Rhizobium]|jgi:hypothetical protein|uniref:urea carboxylase-associated family protein n=1 Tax=Rhizobium TaxID=379 RepID=UPI0009EA6783|nr:MULTISPECIES: DUF1989 domain-containing protein [Rhizobium]